MILPQGLPACSESAEEPRIIDSACEDCGTRQYLNLHHRYCYNFGKSVLYHERDYPDVLKVLCYPCHMKKHGDSAIS